MTSEFENLGYPSLNPLKITVRNFQSGYGMTVGGGGGAGISASMHLSLSIQSSERERKDGRKMERG